MRSIFQRFNPQNTTTGISHLLFLPCWAFLFWDCCRHRHIIHPMDNTIVLWSENWDSSHIGKCESRDLHVFVGVGLVSLAFAKSDPENRSQRRHDLPVLFFCRSLCVAHFTKLLVTSLALPPVVFRPLLPCIAQAHRWSTDRDWNWNCDCFWCDPPAGVHRSHVSPLTGFFCVKMTCEMRPHRGTHHKKQRSTKRTFLTHCKTARHFHIGQPSPGTCGMTDNDPFCR